MSGFQHPFQCIQFIERQSTGSQNLLVASAGSRIYSYVASTGQRLDIWPRDVNPSAGAESSESQAPPEKKRKIASSENASTDDSERTVGGNRDQKSSTWSNIPILTVSSSGQYAVALTAEDKTIRVLKVEGDGTLHQLCARCMPKRPSAIIVTGDDSTILSADKFGDVYSLPLIPSDNPVLRQRNPRQVKLSSPAASNLTVHTQGNLNSLKQQQRQKARQSENQEKSGPDFEHRLILGHVSLLTDLAIASIKTDSNSTRSYLLSADRDEHIRVSRGLPQSHVIENYCLGHTSFISKLCVPRWSPELLISGGGDNYLLVWKWVEGHILQKVPLDQPSEGAELAVSGIWAVSLAESADSSKTFKIILVAIEGTSQLLSYTLESSGTLQPRGHIQLSGNVLSVASMETEGTVLISVDCVREAGSTQTWRANPTSQTLLEAFHVKSSADGLQWEPATEEMTAAANSEGTSHIPADIQEKQRKEMNESLYGLENFRKKNTGEDD